jgi:hypothetical protein
MFHNIMDYIIKRIGANCSSIVADYLCHKKCHKVKYDTVLDELRRHLPTCWKCHAMVCNVGECYLDLYGLYLISSYEHFICSDCYNNASNSMKKMTVSVSLDLNYLLRRGITNFDYSKYYYDDVLKK